MKILIDMNLSPEWVSALKGAGWESIHWSDVGKPSAPDREIFEYAKSNGYMIFTHDLDFGTILAATNAEYPSIIQIRVQDVAPAHLSGFLVSVLNQFEKNLDGGALITIDSNKTRARVLPLRK